jgi:glutathione S-transferase
MALAHKGLTVETIPWRFTEKAMIAFSGQGLVPVLVDDGRVVTDSWAIAVWLEETYPDRPSLFGGAGGRGAARFVQAWADDVLHAALSRLIILDLLAVQTPEDAAYFRESREKRFGMTLEAWAADRPARLEEFRRALRPVRNTLRHQPWLAGAAPGYADHIVLGGFQWARAVSPLALLEAEDPVAEWRGRMMDLHGGLARSTPGYEV